MRVFITGASGFLATALVPALQQSGHEAIALVRREARDRDVQWDPEQPLDPAKLANCDAVVHLAGTSPDAGRTSSNANFWTAACVARGPWRSRSPRAFDDRAGHECSYRRRASATTAIEEMSC